MEKYNKIIHILDLKTKKLQDRGIDVTADEILSFLLDVDWRDGNKRSLAEVTNDILRIEPTKLTRYMAAQAIIKPKDDILENFAEIFGGK